MLVTKQLCIDTIPLLDVKLNAKIMPILNIKFILSLNNEHRWVHHSVFQCHPKQQYVHTDENMSVWNTKHSLLVHLQVESKGLKV